MKSKLLLTCGLVFLFLVFAASGDTQTTKTGTREKDVNGKPTKNEPDPLSAARLVDFSGQGSDEIFPAKDRWQPFGPYRQITVQDRQKIIGSGAAVFGARSGTSRLSVSLCYMKSGNPTLYAFSGNDHLTADAGATRTTFAVSASGTLPAGTYSVGYCVVNHGPEIVDNNDYVNGWLMVVN